MGEEEGGELSGNQILQGFVTLVRSVGHCPEGREEQVKGLNSEGSAHMYILERPLCLDSGGWI